MADHLTEEEQIQALKDWWKHNWQSVIFPIVIVGAGYLGFNFWQEQKVATAAKGEAQFRLLMEKIQTSPGTELTEEQAGEANVIATKIANEYDGTLYADNANLILARLEVDAGNIESAESYLKRVVDSGANRAIQDLAKTRLARIQMAAQKYDAALALVAASGDSQYASQMAEVRGDILAKQGKTDAARTAYEEALKALSMQEYQRRSLLQMKFDGAELLATATSAQTEKPEPQSVEDTETESVDDAAAESADGETAEATAENS